MFAIALIFNFSLTLLCLVLAWRFWKLERWLTDLTSRLTLAEQQVQPELISIRLKNFASGPQALRGKLSLLRVKRQQLRQVLLLLSLGQWAWRLSKRRQRRAK